MEMNNGGNKKGGQGSISTTHWRKVQMCQHKAFGAKRCIEIEYTPKFYTLCSAPYASKFNVNLLVQKLIIKWWWNWPQMKKVRRMSRQWRKGIINCFIDTREKGSRLNQICFWQGLNVVLKNVREKTPIQRLFSMHQTKICRLLARDLWLEGCGFKPYLLLHGSGVKTIGSWHCASTAGLPSCFKLLIWRWDKIKCFDIIK